MPVTAIVPEVTEKISVEVSVIFIIVPIGSPEPGAVYVKWSSVLQIYDIYAVAEAVFSLNKPFCALRLDYAICYKWHSLAYTRTFGVCTMFFLGNRPL